MSAEGDKSTRRALPSLLFIGGLVKLVIYLAKLFEDSNAVAQYYNTNDIYFCVLSVACLLIPPIVYTVFQVAGLLIGPGHVRKADVGTRLVQGLLLVPWQIKSRVEVLHFSSLRLFHRPRLDTEETEEVEEIRRKADVLEFFEDFYAGLLQLVLQTYLILLSLQYKVSTTILIGEVVTSGLTLLSLLQAVRRKDDGILTGFLSWAGWTLLFVARVMALSMAACVLHGWILVPTMTHALAITFWVYFMALESHEGRIVRKSQIFLLSLGLFGVPSLLYWPIMFQLKAYYRPYKYLLLIILENCISILIWYLFSKTNVSFVLLGLVVAACFGGAFFIVLYTFCKPKLTETVALHDMQIRNAESFGIYFDFCNTLFYLPRKQWVEDTLDKVRQQENIVS